MQKKLPRYEEDQDQRAAKVNPGQCGRQVSGRQLGTEQAVKYHQDADGEDRNLQRGPSVPPVKKPSTEYGYRLELGVNHNGSARKDSFDVKLPLQFLTIG